MNDPINPKLAKDIRYAYARVCGEQGGDVTAMPPALVDTVVQGAIVFLEELQAMGWKFVPPEQEPTTERSGNVIEVDFPNKAR